MLETDLLGLLGHAGWVKGDPLDFDQWLLEPRAEVLG